MRKLITITLILFCISGAYSQTPYFSIRNNNGQVIYKVTDLDIHYHSGIALAGLGASTVYYFTERPILASFAGAIFGTGIGLFKEKIWDGAWHNGVDSRDDAGFTAGGAFSIIFHFNIYIDKKRKK